MRRKWISFERGVNDHVPTPWRLVAVTEDFATARRSVTFLPPRTAPKNTDYEDPTDRQYFQTGRCHFSATTYCEWVVIDLENVDKVPGFEHLLSLFKNFQFQMGLLANVAGEAHKRYEDKMKPWKV